MQGGRMNIKLKKDECAVVIRADGGDIFVSGDENEIAERSRYLLAIALHAIQAEKDDDELWALLKRRIAIRADAYEADQEEVSKRRFRVIQGGVVDLPTD